MKYKYPLLAATLIALSTFALYYPFIGNPLIFDDYNLFNGHHSIYDLALVPFNPYPRTFPLFTLGFVETIWKSLEINRLVSIGIHIANALLLGRLVFDLLRLVDRETPPTNALLTATTLSLFFALHPVATYGAGYLAQRTILLATFFGLWAFFFHLRSYRRQAVSDQITAALFYALAVFSKEHAIMLPIAIALSTFLQTAPRHQKLLKTGLFLGLSSCTSIYILLCLKGLIGAYEPAGASSAASLPELALTHSASGQWLLSAIGQAGLFFKYLITWLIPNPGSMSIDMRVDFANNLSPIGIILQLSAFLLLIGGACFLLSKRGLPALAGFGLLYTGTLYLTEFSTFRLQEPFVLYRSYIWAPGIVFSLAAALGMLRLSTRVASAMLLVPLLLFPLAIDRLKSMRSELSIWVDAAEKLTNPTLPGAERIFYNRGHQYLKQGKYAEALLDMQQVVANHPESYEGYIGLANVHAAMNDPVQAAADLDQAEKVTTARTALGQIYFKRALLLLTQKQNLAAEEMLKQASAYGHNGAKVLLEARFSTR